MEKDIQLLLAIGLSEHKAKETLKNVQITKNLKWIINEVRFETINSILNKKNIYHSELQNRIID